jgi:hypothetical protein
VECRRCGQLRDKFRTWARTEQSAEHISQLTDILDAMGAPPLRVALILLGDLTPSRNPLPVRFDKSFP